MLRDLEPRGAECGYRRDRTLLACLYSTPWKGIRHGQSTALLHDTLEIIAPRNAKLNELSDNAVDTIAHRMGVRE